jgi:hypothetical protein
MPFVTVSGIDLSLRIVIVSCLQNIADKYGSIIIKREGIGSIPRTLKYYILPERLFQIYHTATLYFIIKIHPTIVKGPACSISSNFVNRPKFILLLDVYA